MTKKESVINSIAKQIEWKRGLISLTEYEIKVLQRDLNHYSSLPDEKWDEIPTTEVKPKFEA